MTEPSAPQRQTWQRAAVLDALDRHRDFLTAQQLHQQLDEAGQKISLATVYRTLQQMAALGEIDVISDDGKQMAFRRCSSEHHHHLVCTECARTVEVSGPAVERWAVSTADEHGFTHSGHRIEIYGLCATCQQR